MKKKLKMGKKYINEDTLGSQSSQMNRKGEITTDVNTFKQNKDQFNSAIDNGTSVQITNEEDNKLINVDTIIGKLGIDLKNKNTEVISGVKKLIEKLAIILQDKYGVNIYSSDSNSTPKGLHDLYSDSERAERVINYGVKGENTNLLEKKLNNSYSKIIDIKENINPKITKKNLINIIKKQK